MPTTVTVGGEMMQLPRASDASRADQPIESLDARLLERFLVDRDASAFEALLARHGPMVWGVCRRVLADRHDAEDAFQATFLILVRRAGAIGRRELLANWLYGVAYRVAAKSRARRRHESLKETAMLSASLPAELDSDVRAALDDELIQLDDRYRRPVVLCYLQGRTVTEAAAMLGWPRGTVAGRLARARDLLRQRLTRRGITLSSAAIGALFAYSAASARVPPSLIACTLKTVSALAAGQALKTGVVPASVAALTQGVLQSMTPLKLQTVLLALIVIVFVGLGYGAYSHLNSQDRDHVSAAVEDGINLEGPSDAAKPTSTEPKALLERAAALLEQSARDTKQVRPEDDDDIGYKVYRLVAVGRAQFDAGDSEGGAKTFLTARKIVEERPLRPCIRLMALSNVGEAQAWSGDVKAAQATLELLGAIKIEAAEHQLETTARNSVLGAIAAAEAKTGDVKAAMKIVDRIPSANGKAEILRRIVQSQLDAKDYKGAVATVKAIELEQYRLQNQATITQALIKAGDAETARQVIAEMRKTLENSKLDLRQQEQLVWLIASLHAECGDEKAAHAWVEKLESPVLKSSGLLGITVGQLRRKAEAGNAR